MDTVPHAHEPNCNAPRRRTVIALSKGASEATCAFQEALIRARLSILGYAHDDAVVLRNDFDTLLVMACAGEIGTLAVPRMDWVLSRQWEREFVANRMRKYGGAIVSFSDKDSPCMGADPLALALSVGLYPLEQPYQTFDQHLEQELVNVRGLIYLFQGILLRRPIPWDHSKTQRVDPRAPGRATVIFVREDKAPLASCALQEAVLRARLTLLGNCHSGALVLRGDSRTLYQLAMGFEIETLAVTSLRSIGEREGDGVFVAEQVLDNGGEVVSLDPADGHYMLGTPIALAASYDPLTNPHQSVGENLEKDRRRLDAMITEFQAAHDRASSYLRRPRVIEIPVCAAEPVATATPVDVF